MEDELKPKQEKFAQLYVELGNASEAYRQAYQTRAKASSVHVRASELLRDRKVSVRVRQIRDQLAETEMWSKGDSIQLLAEVARKADVADRDRIAAVKVLNGMFGWDRQVIDHKGDTDGLAKSLLKARARVKDKR